MKKLFLALCWVLLALLLLLPLGMILAAASGYTFRITSVPAYVAVTALAAITLLILSFTAKARFQSRTFSVLCSLNAPLSLLFAFFAFLQSPDAVTVCAAVLTVICCIALTVRRSMPIALKITALTLTLLLLIPSVVLGMIGLTVNGMNVKSTLRSVNSPDGTCCAAIVIRDQGALGGNTLVEIRENGGIYTPFFSVTKAPRTVFRGSWEQQFTIRVSWHGDDCLLIDDVEYSIR